MASDATASPRTIAPVASVWCRQVDNEAESPGYTAIPEEFPGRRETMDAIRLVGHLTINVADTHDYWDPEPNRSLSFYPNLFLYPAAGGRYTCVGRMFLSTEDRPRLGMKTLVFPTSDLLASGEFGAIVLRAHAAMAGPAETRPPPLEPDASVYQAVGEGFLFHHGSTDPVVVVASDQWEAAGRAVLELVGALPAALVALGAFLVFPYFLPAAKVNFHEFTEEIPLALAVLRVPRHEAAGDRHLKRIATWREQSINLRDLSRTSVIRIKENLPLVLQQVRDHAPTSELDVAERVDQVEGPRLAAQLADAETATGRERRKEMWKVATAMEAAAHLLQKTRGGRPANATPETTRRANEYVQTQPGARPSVRAAVLVPPAASPPPPVAVGPLERSAPPPLSSEPSRPRSSGDPAEPKPPAAPPTPVPAPAVPSWLRPATSLAIPSETPGAVPVSTSEDPSLLPRSSVPASRPPPRPPATAPPGTPSIPSPPPRPSSTEPASAPPPTSGGSAPDMAREASLRIALVAKDLEQRWNLVLDARLKEMGARLSETVRTELLARLAEREAKMPTTEALEAAVTAAVAARLGPAVNGLEQRTADAARQSAEAWAERLRRDLELVTQRLDARVASAEGALRSAFLGEVEREAKVSRGETQALREELERKVRELREAAAAAAAARPARPAPAAGGTAGLSAAASAELERRLATIVDRRLAEHDSALDQRLISGLEETRGEVDRAVARALASPEFDVSLGARIARAVESEALALGAASASAPSGEPLLSEQVLGRLGELERRLGLRDGDLVALESTMRSELDDLDERVKLVNEHVVPVVRQTWIKLTEQEANLQAKTHEESLATIRKELVQEIQRVEEALFREQAALRERLENSVANQDRLWLNFVRQFSASPGGMPTPALPASHRFPRRARPGPGSAGESLDTDRGR